MRKSSLFFVATLLLLLFLNLTFAACGGSGVPFTKTQSAQASSYHANYPGGAGPQPGAAQSYHAKEHLALSPTRDPVQVYDLMWHPMAGTWPREAVITP